MITNFNNKMFVFKNLSKWLVVLLVYALLSGNPVLIINSMDIIPQINVRELIWLLMGQTFDVAFFGMGFAFLCVSFFNICFEKYNVFDGLDIRYSFLEKNDMSDVFVDAILDFSNPFLRSSKTKGLRE